jgi:hypothetical protein
MASRRKTKENGAHPKKKDEQLPTVDVRTSHQKSKEQPGKELGKAETIKKEAEIY